MKAKSSLNSSCFSHIKRMLSLITRILVNTRLIPLFGSITDLLTGSVQVLQMIIMLTESSVLLLTGTSSLNSSCFSHIKRTLSLITRILVNTRPIPLFGSITDLLTGSVQVLQRKIMLTESSVLLLTGTFPGCYTKEHYAY